MFASARLGLAPCPVDRYGVAAVVSLADASLRLARENCLAVVFPGRNEVPFPPWERLPGAARWIHESRTRPAGSVSEAMRTLPGRSGNSAVTTPTERLKERYSVPPRVKSTRALQELFIEIGTRHRQSRPISARSLEDRNRSGGGVSHDVSTAIHRRVCRPKRTKPEGRGENRDRSRARSLLRA